MKKPHVKDMPWWGWILIGLVLGGGGLSRTLEWQIPFVGELHLHLDGEEEEHTEPEPEPEPEPVPDPEPDDGWFS